MKQSQSKIENMKNLDFYKRQTVNSFNSNMSMGELNRKKAPSSATPKQNLQDLKKMRTLRD